MKHLQKLGYTALGAILALTVVAAVPAIAAQIQSIDATLNSVNIEVNGAKVASAGEDYTLDNGKQTAGSIVYNETTYVPIRRFGEVMGADIGWNQETGSVTVAGEVKAADPTTTLAPDTALSDDYSTWTPEEEAAYQEFKGMWSVEDTAVNESSLMYAEATCPQNKKDKLIQFLNAHSEENVCMFAKRFFLNLREATKPSSTASSVTYYADGLQDYLWSDTRLVTENSLYIDYSKDMVLGTLIKD